MMVGSQFILSARDPANIVRVASMLRSGGVAVVPTDTVYGLAASIYQDQAVARVFEIKQRPPDARVPVLIASASDLLGLAEEITRPAWKLIERFWPGPLTLVLPAGPMAPESITMGGDSIAVRVPAGRSILSLLQRVRDPLVGTSANVSGRPPAVTAAAAVAQLGGADAVLEDDDAVRLGTSSTVVEVTDDGLMVHRIGAIGAEQLRQASGVLPFIV